MGVRVPPRSPTTMKPDTEKAYIKKLIYLTNKFRSYDGFELALKKKQTKKKKKKTTKKKIAEIKIKTKQVKFGLEPRKFDI